jgi:hypothetical protein
MTVEQALHHPFVTAQETIDPLSLYSRAAIPLPLTGAGAGDGTGQIEDKEWARRQCSIVWAPMPMSYDFASSSASGSSGDGARGRGGRGADLDGAIFESEAEFGSKF